MDSEKKETDFCDFLNERLRILADRTAAARNKHEETLRAPELFTEEERFLAWLECVRITVDPEIQFFCSLADQLLSEE